MPADESDSDLLSRAVSGDQSALERLLLSVHDQLVGRIAPRIPADLASSVAADDVLQEAYVVAFREITSFEPRGSGTFLAWLTKIAELRLSEALRRQRALKRGGGRVRIDTGPADETRSMIDALGALGVSPRTPSRSAATKEAVAAVRAALGEVPAEYREALQHRYIEGLSVAETAEKMGKSPRAVHMLCYRGLAAVREALGGDAAKFFSAT